MPANVTPRSRSPCATSPAIIGEPLSVISERGRPSFMNAWLRPWTKASEVSPRYHCAWAQIREWSSRIASSLGRTTSPFLVVMLKLAQWKSACHRAFECPCSYASVSRRSRRGGSPGRGLGRRARPRSFMMRRSVDTDGTGPISGLSASSATRFL